MHLGYLHVNLYLDVIFVRKGKLSAKERASGLGTGTVLAVLRTGKVSDPAPVLRGGVDRTAENEMMNKASILTFMFFLLWPCGMVSAQVETITPPDSHVSTIDQIWNDGTLLLKNGMKIRVSREALKRSEIKANQEIMILKDGKNCEDAKGRKVGWLLIMDAGRRERPAMPSPDVEMSVQENDMAHILATQGEAFNSVNYTGYDLISAATVAPPVGAGLREFQKRAAPLASSGTVFLEDGKQVRVGKNVLRDSMRAHSARLVFCASRSKETASVVREILTRSRPAA